MKSPFKEQLRVRYKQIRDNICKNTHLSSSKPKPSPRKPKKADTLSNEDIIQQMSLERINSNQIGNNINDLDV